MSLYGTLNFKLVMGENKNEKKPETVTDFQTTNKVYLPQYFALISKALFQNILPNINTKDDLYKFILEISKIEKELSLNEKYICSILLAINKNLLTEEIINDILEEEFHLTLMNWLMEGKYIVKEKTKYEVYKFNIYIGLLINIISLYEIFPIKPKDLSEFNLYKKLFKLNSLIELNINNSFPFLFSLNNLLKKWKKQIDNYLLSKTIENLTLIRKKNKRSIYKEYNNINDINEKDKNSTEADSEEKEKEEGIIFSRKNKKVCFDLHNIQNFFYDKNNSPSDYLNIIKNKGYGSLSNSQNC